jgi:hypothetical protein
VLDVRQDEASRHEGWTEAKELAAVLVADDELTNHEIAAKVGVGHATLERWRLKPDFARRVREIIAAIGAPAQRRAIGKRARRLAKLEDRWMRLLRVIEERAADPAMKDVPGGTTGLLVKRVRRTKAGVVEEYAVDVALLKELRETERQAAIEAGQWTEKRELSGPDGGPIKAKVDHGVESLAQYAEAMREVLARCEAGVPPALPGP